PADRQASGLTFSPDGSYIYYTRIEKQRPGLGLLYQIPVLGGAPRLIVTDVDSRISFSPDGRRFAFRRDSSERKTSAILTVDADGSPSWLPSASPVKIARAFRSLEAGRKAKTGASAAGVGAEGTKAAVTRGG